MNIIPFTRQIINVAKMDIELRHLPLTGSKYSFHVRKGDDLKLYYSDNLIQSEVDEVSGYINNFVEISVLDAEVDVTIRKQADGWDLYKKIIASINTNGGLGTIDDGIASYTAMFTIRNMLKDGFFEYSLRHVVTVIEPAAILPVELTDQYKLWIREKIAEYSGLDEATMDLIETAPQGAI